MGTLTEDLARADQIIWQLSGMHCPSCAQNIETSIKKIDGVKDAIVNYVNSQVTVFFDKNQVSSEQIKKVINQLGYTIKDEDTQIIEQSWQIKGMHCPSCAQNIETSIKRLGGISDASINYVTKKGVIRFDKRQINVEQLKKVIINLGYEVKEEQKLYKTFSEKYLPIIQVFLTALFLLLSWIAGWQKWQIDFFPSPLNNLESLFAIIGIIIGWYEILTTAIKTLISFNLNVDVLVSIAVIASLFVPAYKEAVTVIFIVLLGEFLENFTVSKTRMAIKKLVELMPDKVRIKKHGKEEQIPIADVVIDDIVIIKPGEQVPVDGELLTDDAMLNESAITGESVPVYKKINEKILAGSISDGSYIEIKATEVGENTTLSKIRILVEDAQNKKANIQRLTDKFAKYFIPAIFIIAIIVGVITSDITRVVTVLIAACPCTLVIATPVAIVAGIGRGANRGILIKGGEYMENIGFTDTVVFDKTGTLTIGKPEVVQVKNFDNHDTGSIIELAGALESCSEHHIGAAILKKAKELNINIKIAECVKVIKGRGISGYYNNNEILLGNLALMEENGIIISGLAQQYIDEQQKEGKTVISVAHDKKICGVISISDTVRESAKTTIVDIKNIGIKNIWLLTGDNEIIAKNVAQSLNIDNYMAKMLPEDKIEQIKNLQNQGKKVVMVGDGINDAPALVTADIGIAMGVAGTAIAIESADIALMKDDLSKISEVIRLGRKTVSIIKQNITFALLYNVFIITVAAFGFIHMIHGAVFHQISSLFVILNAMRLLVHK